MKRIDQLKAKQKAKRAELTIRLRHYGAAARAVDKVTKELMALNERIKGEIDKGN